MKKLHSVKFLLESIIEPQPTDHKMFEESILLVELEENDTQEQQYAYLENVIKERTETE